MKSFLRSILAAAVVVCGYSFLADAGYRVPSLQTITCSAGQYINSVSPALVPSCGTVAAANVTGLGTAATVNTGTSGATIPLLNGANTWGATQLFNGTFLMEDGGTATYPAGAFTEANAQLFEFGINDTRLGSVTTAAQGGFVRFDARAAAAPNFYSVYGKPAGVAGGTSAASLVFNVSTVGTLTIPKEASAPATAPGAGFINLFALAGTNAGTCKLMMQAGTSTTAVLVLDNVGTGC
jgi:hypothetical protein